MPSLQRMRMFPHQRASLRLANALAMALPDLIVVQEVSAKLSSNRIRIPDISVLDHAPESFFVTDPPRLVVEILSPSTRSEDTVRKSGEYAAAGIGQYWLLDPEVRPRYLCQRVRRVVAAVAS